MSNVRVINADALDALKEIPDASVDSVVTDPPYELGFMGKGWDASGIAYSVDLWREAYRVIKPGGYLLAFGGTRTAHRLTCAIEDAGFEIRDGIDWLYGTGFPKSLDVSKAIDKAAGAEREVIGTIPDRWTGKGSVMNRNGRDVVNGLATGEPAVITGAPATEDAARWSGWGTALKPAREPIVVARKPFVGTVAANVLAYGTGALNIDACRTDAGRWPSNVVLSHAPDCAEECLPGCPVAELDRQSGNRPGAVSNGSKTAKGLAGSATFRIHEREQKPGYADDGGASRFFPVFRYQAKAPTSERPRVNGIVHPTVKPLALMRWLTRLVTSSGGTVLDLFGGSGTTAEACLLEGFNCVTIESEESYIPLINTRIERASLEASAIQ